MRDHIETEHLTLRPFKAEDAEAAYSWLGDGEVMRYMPAGPDGSLGQTIARLATYREHQLVYGYSKWLVSDRDSGAPIGDAGLLWLPGAENVDLGFRFLKHSWGRGFGREVARAWIHVAFAELNLARLAAFAHPENTNAFRVLDRVGFRRIGICRVLGMEAVSFGLEWGDARLFSPEKGAGR